MNQRKIYAYFVAPSVILVLIFSIYPSFYSIFLSFTNKSLVFREQSIVGLSNYLEMFRSPEFWNSLKVTLIYVVGSVFFQLTLGIFLALLTEKNRPGRKFIRTVVLISWVIPEVIVSLIFKWMFIGDKYGLVNAFLLHIGLINHSIQWLSQGSLTLMVAIGMNIWRGVAFSMILEMAAIHSVPLNLYESAAIDGAGYLQALFYITIPYIMATILINLIIITISTFNVMSQVYVFSGGGPVRATELVSIYMYKSAFRMFRLGYASAISIIMFLINILFTFVYINRTKKDFIL